MRDRDISYEMASRPRFEPKMPCGGTPIADMDSSIGAYRCDKCSAVVGSIGQPRACVEVNRGSS